MRRRAWCRAAMGGPGVCESPPAPPVSNAGTRAVLAALGPRGSGPPVRPNSRFAGTAAGSGPRPRLKFRVSSASEPGKAGDGPGPSPYRSLLSSGIVTRMIRWCPARPCRPRLAAAHGGRSSRITRRKTPTYTRLPLESSIAEHDSTAGNSCRMAANAIGPHGRLRAVPPLGDLAFNYLGPTHTCSCPSGTWASRPAMHGRRVNGDRGFGQQRATA